MPLLYAAAVMTSLTGLLRQGVSVDLLIPFMNSAGSVRVKSGK